MTAKLGIMIHHHLKLGYVCKRGLSYVQNILLLVIDVTNS